MAQFMAPSWIQPSAGFRSRKAAQICAYFATQSEGTIEKLKLIKMIYLAERKYLFAHHHPMLFDEFYSLPHGPICSSTLNGINGTLGDSFWDEYIARNGNIVVAVKAVARDDLDEISDAEMAVIEEVWEEFSKMTASQIRNYTHDNCSEYTETD
ncbi:MAG: Panacea domain-containing protein, partial [Gemmatimonadetes bacterium]|nr:Panacea domain-containing protein [Gemmatimonadota bacterium]